MATPFDRSAEKRGQVDKKGKHIAQWQQPEVIVMPPQPASAPPQQKNTRCQSSDQHDDACCRQALKQKGKQRDRQRISHDRRGVTDGRQQQIRFGPAQFLPQKRRGAGLAADMLYRERLRYGNTIAARANGTAEFVIVGKHVGERFKAADLFKRPTAKRNCRSETGWASPSVSPSCAFGKK